MAQSDLESPQPHPSSSGCGNPDDAKSQLSVSLKPELNTRVQENASSEDDAPPCTAETPEDVSVDDGKKPITSEISLSALDTLPACLTVVDKTHLLCTACDVSIKIQDSNKLGNVTRHLTSITHQMKTSNMTADACAQLQKKFPGMFIQHGDQAWCADCGKKGTISLMGKNLMVNASRHIESDRHKESARKVGGSSSKKITSFFTKRPASSEGE